MPHSDLSEFAMSWADELGYSLTVSYEPDVKGLAHIGRPILGRDKTADLILDERVLDLARPTQETIVAHEMGHLATDRSMFRMAMFGLWVDVLAVVVTFLFAEPGAVFVVGLPMLPLIGAAFAGLRRGELLADQWAARQGYPFTHQHVAALELANLNDRQHVTGVARLWEQHPSVDERVAHTSRYL